MEYVSQYQELSEYSSSFVYGMMMMMKIIIIIIIIIISIIVIIYHHHHDNHQIPPPHHQVTATPLPDLEEIVEVSLQPASALLEEPTPTRYLGHDGHCGLGGAGGHHGCGSGGDHK